MLRLKLSGLKVKKNQWGSWVERKNLLLKRIVGVLSSLDVNSSFLPLLFRLPETKVLSVRTDKRPVSS